VELATQLYQAPELKLSEAKSLLNLQSFLWLCGSRRDNCTSSHYAHSLWRVRTGRCGDRIPLEAIFSASVQTGPGAHPDSYTMGT